MAVSRFIAIFSADQAHLMEIGPLLSPRLEICPPDGILLQVPVRYEQDTVNRLAKLANRDCKIGGASTRTAAILAAKTRPGTLIPYGRDRDFISALPVRLLSLCTPVDQGILETLSRWGIRTCGELAALPKSSLTARLGEKGLLLQKIALGQDVERYRPLQSEPVFEETQELEWTLDSIEPLSFILTGMLEKLCSRLKAQGLAIERIEVRLRLTAGSNYSRSLRFAYPMQNPKIILSLIRLDFQGNPPTSGINGIFIKAIPGRPRHLQHSLLEVFSPHPEKFSQTIRRLESLVGEGNVGAPLLLDTHRPDAVRLQPFELDPENRRRKNNRAFKESEGAGTAVSYSSTRLCLRRLRPPISIQIQRERILACAGPWRSCGHWWGTEKTRNKWSRDEWDVEFIDGKICRVYWDHDQSEWFLEGIYD